MKEGCAEHLWCSSVLFLGLTGSNRGTCFIILCACVQYGLTCSVVKNPPAMQETQFRSLGQKDPLEKEMATHSSILAWRIPWTEEPGGLQSMGL